MIIAGPNGAGKSTLYRALELPGLFVNADDIARKLDPGRPETRSLAAGRMTIRTLDHLIDSGQSFVYETTLSSRQSVRLVGKARLAGFSVALFFLALENVELHIERVGHRVSLGGHAIPSEAIRRRYATSFSNLRAILPQVDQAVLIDNSGISGMRIIARLVRSSLISSDFDSGSNVDRLVAGCLEEALGIRIGTVG